MEHGPTHDNDMTLLFITNKPFDIHYTFEDEEQGTRTAQAPPPPSIRSPVPTILGWRKRHVPTCGTPGTR